MFQILSIGMKKWDKVFKNGPNKIFGRQPLKKLKGLWSAEAEKNKGCLPQILLGPFLNTFSQMFLLHL